MIRMIRVWWILKPTTWVHFWPSLTLWLVLTQPTLPWHPISHATPPTYHLLGLDSLIYSVMWFLTFASLAWEVFFFFFSFLFCGVYTCLGLLYCTAGQKYLNTNISQEFVYRFSSSFSQRKGVSEAYLPLPPQSFWWNQTPCLAVNPSVTVSCLSSPTGVSWDNSQINCYCESSGHVRLLETPWTAAHQASQSLIISLGLPKFLSIAQWCYPAVSSSDALFFLLALKSLFQGLLLWKAE